MSSSWYDLKLKNTFYLLRHGESEANVAGIITSDPHQCLTKYGLTHFGKAAVTASVMRAQHDNWLTNETLIYSSDFKRAAETAEIAQRLLLANPIHYRKELRERNFGEYHGEHPLTYVEIWPKNNQEKYDQRDKGVEDAKSIAHRLFVLIHELEALHQQRQILLVSHGDLLQVLQAAFQGLTPAQGRALSYIQPGEIRKLEQIVK